MRSKPTPLLPWIVAGATFMEALDGTVVVTALPQIAQTFGVPAASLGLGVTAYLVSLTVFVPASAWAAERFGSRTVFVGAIGLFTVASILCGLAGSFPAFVAARALQGFAAAMMSPVGRLVILRTTEKKDLVRAVAAITWPALIAPVIAPAVGGLIATHASWPWIFYLNLPLGIVGMALAARYTPQQKAQAHPPFDLTGFVLTGCALGGLVVGLDLLGLADAEAWLGWSLLGASLLIGAAAVGHARRARHPMLDLRPLKEPLFRITSATAGFLARVAIMGTPFLVPLLFQLGFGYDPLEAGTMLLVYMAGNLAMKTVTTPALRLFGFRRALVAANLVSAAALTGCGLFSPEWPPPAMYAVLFVAGLSRSMTFTSVNTLTFAETTPEQRPAATALSTLSHQLGATLGVAFAALVLNASLGVTGGAAISLAQFRIAFGFLAALSLVSALWFATLPADAGAEVSGHRRG